jgi:hypothetical protein
MSENILITYYSWSGNIRKVAQKIHEITKNKGGQANFSTDLPFLLCQKVKHGYSFLFLRSLRPLR